MCWLICHFAFEPNNWVIELGWWTNCHTINSLCFKQELSHLSPSGDLGIAMNLGSAMNLHYST